MIRAIRPFFLLPLLCLLLGACATRENTAEKEAPMPQCATAYTFAPGNYIIDIASGSDVVLDPLMHDFLLFCEAGAARQYVDKEVAAHRLPRGDWRIYVVEGEFADLAQPDGNGRHVLRRMAPLVDWVNENPAAMMP